MSVMDFDSAKILAQSEIPSNENKSINTYNERSQHRTLKFLFEQDSAFHEVKVGPYIADVCKGRNIFEIQTAGFGALKNKIKYFIEDYNVTVVYPVPTIKTIMWTDTETGEITEGRRFSMPRAKYKLLKELIYIVELLEYDNLSILLLETETYEYRMLDGRGTEGKIKATKVDTVPVRVLNTISVKNIDDIIGFLPFDKGIKYKRADIQKALQLKGRNLSAAIKTLLMLDILTKCKTGRDVFYEIAK